eukprot:scaffold29055_cov57-Phaeocystis_antarctica.AAC.1
MITPEEMGRRRKAAGLIQTLWRGRCDLAQCDLVPRPQPRLGSSRPTLQLLVALLALLVLLALL